MMKKYIPFIVPLALILGVLIITSSWKNSHPAIHISTDSTPLNFEINNKAYEMNKSSKDIRLPRGSYNYRVTYGNRTLYGTTNTIDGPTKITLNYKLFTEEAVIDALCNEETLNPCTYREIPGLTVSFIVDNNWAILRGEVAKDRGIGFVVMKLDNGKWTKAAGPLWNPELYNGKLPREVQGELR